MTCTQCAYVSVLANSPRTTARRPSCELFKLYKQQRDVLATSPMLILTLLRTSRQLARFTAQVIGRRKVVAILSARSASRTPETLRRRHFGA